MPKTEQAARQFEHPLTDRTRLDAAMHFLAEELALRLEKRNMAIQAVRLKLYLEDGQTQMEALHLLQPVASAAGIARTIQQLAERVRLTKGVTALEVSSAHLVANTLRQLELFGYQPGRAQLIDLANILVTRHSGCFYQAAPDEPEALLPERRFRLIRLDAS